MLKDFISKKNNRKFKAFLVLKDGGTAFEFPPRERKSRSKAAKPKEPQPKIDFTGKEPLGKCPKCGGKVFETDAGLPLREVAGGQEAVQIQDQPGNFAAADRAGAGAEAAWPTRKTDLLDKFISKAGRPFPAYLVMDDTGKVTFEFPPREGEATT